MPRLLLLAGLFLSASTTHGQEAPVFLEPGHWTWDAIRLLDAAGLAPAAADGAYAGVTIAHARTAFAHAVAIGDSVGRPALSSLAGAWLRRLEAESRTALLGGASLGAGWMVSRGEALGGEGYFVGQDWVGAQPLPATNGPALVADGHGWITTWLSWSATGGRMADEWVVPAAVLGAALGPLDLWAGRRRLHFGPGRGGAIVAGSGTRDLPMFAHRTLDTFDGIGLQTQDAFHFPRPLKWLGATRFEIVGGRIPENGRVEYPFVVFSRLTATPFTERLTLGATRGAIFGGRGSDMSVGNLLGVIVGLHNEIFEDQVMSLLAHYRPPLGPLPIRVYLEYGADDTSGALRDTPAYIAGFDIGALPGMPHVSFTLEHTRYTGSCCGNPQWYRNIFFRGSWSDDGHLFAHALGGHGYEWLAHARLDLPDLGLLMGGEVFNRWRGHENLFAPERAGLSVGALVSIELRRGGSVLRVDGGYEDAASWSQHRLSALVSHRFR